MRYMLGVDIGGTKSAVVIGMVTENEVKPIIVDKLTFPSEVNRGPQFMIAKMMDSFDKLIISNEIKRDQIEGIGISCGGPLDSKKGIIKSPPHLYGWDDIHIVELFEQRFGLRTKLQNDANASALAEWKFGAARGYNNVVLLTFGTGMGAGLILNGMLYSGTNDMAGEIGHIRLSEHGPVGYGKSGSFEGFCSGSGIAQIARMKVLEKLQKGEKVSFCESIDHMDALSAKSIADAANQGDLLAQEIYRISGQQLGKGLSILVDILNPEVIVIGSVFTRNISLLWPSAQEVMLKECLHLSNDVCKVVPAQLGDQIGDYAALAVASS